MAQDQVIIRRSGHQILDELDATDIPDLSGAYDAAGAAATAASGAASALSTHAGAADPHTAYALESALGTAAAANTGDFDAAGAASSAQSAAISAAASDATTKANAAQAAAIAASQPVDSDLTAIAALTTTSYGRAFLELADAAAGRTALALGTAATHATGDYDAAGAAAAAQSASQPLDSDLTALAALTTTSYGRSVLETANAAALRTLAGLGTAAVAATGDFDAAGAAAAAQAASQPLDADLTAVAALTTTAFGRALLALADPADATKFLNGAGAFTSPTAGNNAADNLYLIANYR